MEPLRVILLGTGTSHGIPMIGCDCAVCSSDDPRDRRTRSSIVVQTRGRSFLIDTTPELRIQCLANTITRVDAVLFTHYHTDHLAGLDDLRRFNDLQAAPVTCYGDEATLATLERMFPYAFQDNPDYPSSKPQLKLARIDGPFEVLGTSIVPVPLMHGPMQVFGFRFGRFAYCTDVSGIPADSLKLLEGLDALVLGALRRRRHPTHFNLEQAVEAAHQIGAQRTFFTHIAHELPHEATNAELPDTMALGYDGQVITLSE